MSAACLPRAAHTSRKNAGTYALPADFSTSPANDRRATLCVSEQSGHGIALSEVATRASLIPGVGVGSRAACVRFRAAAAQSLIESVRSPAAIAQSLIEVVLPPTTQVLRLALPSDHAGAAPHYGAGHSP